MWAASVRGSRANSRLAHHVDDWKDDAVDANTPDDRIVLVEYVLGNRRERP